MRLKLPPKTVGSFRRNHVFELAAFTQGQFSYIAPPELCTTASRAGCIRHGPGDDGFILNVKELNGPYRPRIAMSSKIIVLRYALRSQSRIASTPPAMRPPR